MGNSNHAVSVSAQNTVAQRAFFVMLNGEAIKINIPDDYLDIIASEEAKEWCQKHPMTLKEVIDLDKVYDSRERSIEYTAGNFLRFLCEPWYSIGFAPSWSELKETMKWAYGFCKRNPGMKPMAKYLDGFNNHLVRQWLKVLPTIE